MKLETFLTVVLGLLLVIPKCFGALPDLVPTALQVPASITDTPNPRVTISWSVTNQGGSPADGYFYDGLYISTNMTFDNSASAFSSWYVGPLQPGDSYSSTNTFQLPIGFSGTYYLQFKTDNSNYVPESDENNNVIVAPLHFEEVPPDLAPVSTLTPDLVTGPPNPVLTLIWSTTNLGPGTTSLGWADSIYLSTNAALTSSATLLGYFFPPGPVPPGKSYWQTNSVQIPVVASGDYFLIFKADADNSLYEVNLSNNVLAVPISFDIRPPDLAALPLQVPNNVVSLANPSLSIVWGVTNQGEVLAQGYWTDQLFLSTNNVLDEFSDRIVATVFENGPVAPGTSYWRTNLAILPIRQSGTYYLIFRTDAQNTLFETQLSNNVTILPITFDIQLPDLSPIVFQVPTVVTSPPNPSLTVSWGVTNLGNGSTTGYWQDEVYFSKDPVLDPSDIRLLSQFEGSPIDSGEDYWRTNTLRIPVTQSGTYYLIYLADDGNPLNESDTNNNTIAMPVTFTILPPNLAPIALQFPSPITSPPNPIVQLIWGVTNSGIGTAVGYWYDKVYLSSDPQLDSSDPQLFGSSEPGPIPSGGSYWRTNSAQVPVNQSGTYYIIFAANADSSSKIFESDYTDNIQVVPITFNILPPDLAPLASRLPNSVTGPPYPTITLVWGITNQGIGAATGAGWSDGVYLSTDPFWSFADSLVASAYDFGPIPPGGTLWLTNTARLPVPVSGTNYLILQLNEDHSLFESDYNNNVAVTPVNFDIRPPDLAPIALQVPSTITGPPYPSVTVVWGVTNQGDGSAIGNYSWSDHLYVSTNAIWDANASDVFALAEQGPVAPASTYWRTKTVRLPVTSSGIYHLFFKANAYQDLIESSYSNNTASLAFTFNVQLPDLTPVSVQVPSMVTGPPYPGITYVWGVTNQGPGTALAYSASWSDVVALSTNEVWDWSDYQLGYGYQAGPVLANGVYWQTNTLRMPITQSGQYYLIFNTDADLSLVEADYSNNIVVAPITFNIQPPDLAPVALQVPATLTGPPNPSLTVIWGVTNLGVGPAIGFDYWYDQLYLSTDPVRDFQDTPIANSNESGPIAPGQSYWRTNTIHVPITQSGTYYLIFGVDNGSGLIESDESNNVAVVPITITILPPDLAPVTPSFTQAITGPPNPTFTLVWGVTNQGAGQAIGISPWNDRVYFSKNAKLDIQDVVISSLYESGPIDPGGVVWQTNSVWAPVVQSGNYYLIFEANSDSYSRLYESNYSNNLAVVPVTFNILRPDLAPVALEIPAHITTTPNPTLTFVWSITNQGPGAATSPDSVVNWSDVLYFSTNATLGQGEQSLTTDYPSSPVPPGDSYRRTNSVTVPVVHSGTYYFILQADSNGGLYESDYNNNTLAVPVTFTILPPDLSPLALQVSSVVTSTPNPRLSVTWGVTNQGIGTAQGSWSDVVYLSTHSTLDASAVALSYNSENGPVPADGTYWRTNLLRIPVVQSGDYYLIFAANTGNYLFESDFNNNQIAVHLTFTIFPPDLASIALKAPSQVTGPPNPTLDLSWGVTNQGVGPAVPSAFWTDRIYLSSTPALDQWNGQVLINQYQQQQVAPGGEYWRSQWVQVPVLADGTYYLIFKTDADDVLYESDENNNTLAVPVTFKILLPDLVPIALQAPTVVAFSPYPNIKLTWGVTNQGAGPAATGWQDAIYLSSDTTLDTSDKFLAYRSEPGPLPAGSSYWRTQMIQVPVTNSGNYYLIFRTGTDNNLHESDANNNVLAVPVTFNISAPDLAPIAVLAPTNVSGPPNPALTLVWGVTNQGPGDILTGTGYWLDQVYFSTNASLDTSTAFPIISTYETGPISAHGAYWRTNTVQVPVTQDGIYYLFLDVNSASYQFIFESDYSNNLALARVMFHILPPDLAPIFLQGSVPTPTAPSPLVTVVWGVTNQGAGLAQGYPTSWAVTLSVTRTNSTDGSVVAVGSSYWIQTNLIAAGESYWSTNSVPFPIIESGTYFLTLTVNGDGRLDESDTNNNSVTNLLSVTIAPSDVTPIFFAAPATVTGPAYPEVTVAWGVTNRGLSAALPPYYYSFFYWYDRLYLSTNSFLDSSALTVGDWPQNDIIPSGGNYWRTNTIQLPIQRSGNYFLILQLDAFDALQEANLSNNVVVIPVSLNVLPPSDLAPLHFETSTNLSVPPNPTLTFVWGVTNQGSGPAQAQQGWNDAVYFSTVPVLDGNERYIGGSYETNILALGAGYWRTNSGVVPVITSGTYYLVFKTDVYFTALESDYDNNTIVVPVTFNITPPDLRPVAFYAPAAITGAPNPSVTTVVGVTNQGAGAALDAYDSIYISATPTHDFSAKLIAFWSRTNTIAPGGSYWLTNTVRLPVGDSGNYYLIFEADADNVLLESDPLNNVAVVPIRLELSLEPDLAVQDVQFPSVVTGPPNPTIQLSWYVVNQGLGPAVGPWSDTVLLFTNQSFAPAVVLGTFEENISLPTGSGYWRTNTLTLPIAQNGSFYLSFQADVGNDLFELDYNNNSWFAPFSVNLTTAFAAGLTAGQLLADGSFLLAVSASKGAAYTLQSSTNLVDWVRSMDFICVDEPTWLMDREAASSVQRFYRVAPYKGTQATPLRLDLSSAQPWSASGFGLKLDGPLMVAYRIQTSTNLADWVTTTNFPDILVSPVYFRDDSATHGGYRFYRAVTP